MCAAFKGEREPGTPLAWKCSVRFLLYICKPMTYTMAQHLH
jgi:hypothetical protein